MHTVIQMTWLHLMDLSEYTVTNWAAWLEDEYPDNADFAYETDLMEHYGDLEYSYGGCILDFRNKKILGAYERSLDEYLFNRLIGMFLCNVIIFDPLIDTDNILSVRFLAARDIDIDHAGFLFDIDYK